MPETKDTIYAPHTPVKTGEKEKNIADNNEEEYDWGKHPNTLKSLKKNQFPKGVSGNVMGRPLNLSALKKSIQSIADEEVYNYRDELQGTRKEVVIHRIWKDAQDGDWKKIQLLAVLGCLD